MMNSIKDNWSRDHEGDKSLGTKSNEFDKTVNISKKVSKLLESRFDSDKDTISALKELSNFFTENTLHSRRNLRSKIEKRSLQINEDFLNAFHFVKKNLDAVHNDVKVISDAVDNISSRLDSSMTQTHILIDQTSKLQLEREKLVLEEDVIVVFLKRFQLTGVELAALREAAVTDDFFTSLDRVQKIHSDCRTLLNCGHQTIALDIMDQMSMYQEAAMERLYRWAQLHCKNIESTTMSELLAKAMAKLQTRPVLLKYVVNEYCNQRRGLLVRWFLDALTKEGPQGNPPPIEMYSDDPRRYISEMFLFLEHAIPKEKVLLNLLLKKCVQTDVGEIIEQSISDISEGICNPFRVRFEHIITPGIPVKVLYAITTVVASNVRTFSKEVGASSGLVKWLSELSDLANDRLLEVLNNLVKTEVTERVSAPPPSDLTPSPALVYLCQLLVTILSTPVDSLHNNINKIVGFVVDPLLQGVNLSASRLSTADSAVFQLNCLHQIQTSLALYQFLDDRLERLQAQCEAQLDTLTSEQASFLVANLSLGHIYTILQEPGKGVLSQIPGMHSTNLSNFVAKLESYLSMPQLLVLPQINLLVSGLHRVTIHKRSCEVILAIYNELYRAVHDPNNQYQRPKDILPRTPQELRQMLLSSK